MSLYNNTITVEGRVGKEPEIKEIEGVGTVAKFSLAVYRTGKGDNKKTDWFWIEAWHDLARGMAQIGKGTMLLIKGTLKANRVEETTYYTIVANSIGKDISIQKETEEENPF